MSGVPSRSDLRRAGVWTNGDQAVVANGPDIAGVEREEGFRLSRRCDEFDLEGVGFIHVDDGAEVAALQAPVWPFQNSANRVFLPIPRGLDPLPWPCPARGTGLTVKPD